MDPLAIDVELNSADWDALQRYLQARLRQRAPKRNYALNMLLAAVPAVFILWASAALSRHQPPAAIGVGLIVSGFCVLLLMQRARRATRPAAGSSMMKPTRFELDAIGVRATRTYQSGFIDWLEIEQVGETSEHVFLPVSALSAYVIPKRCIGSMSPESFVAQVRRWHAERRAPNAAADVPQIAVPATTPSARPDENVPAIRRFASALRANLAAGLRALLFRHVAPTDFEVSFEQIAALLGLSLLVAAVLDRLGAGPDDQLVPANLYTWSVLLLVGLWACGLIARITKPAVPTRLLFVATLSVAPWALIIACACSFVPALTDANGALLLGVAILIVLWGSMRIVRAVYGSLRLSALSIVIAAVAVVAFADDYLALDPHLWEQVAADDDESTGWQDAESTFYDQPGFIDESLQKLAPERPGITDLYYVAFAGDGDQRVFRREALFGEQVFAARMGTGPRSLELINDRESRTDFPLATATGLRYSLSQLAKLMDPKEDVLVLFLTSHGSRESGIYVHTGVTPVDNDLPPDEVRSALDDAGIRWRIVIVSACYAGVFVEPLKSDTTMIITAADSLHTSFGCADDRDLTYFGEAFLKDALPRARSLDAAFEQARKEIAEREVEEKLTPSNPQMWVGASMSKKLAQLGPLPLAAAPPTSSTK